MVRSRVGKERFGSGDCETPAVASGGSLGLPAASAPP